MSQRARPIRRRLKALAVRCVVPTLALGVSVRGAEPEPALVRGPAPASEVGELSPVYPVPPNAPVRRYVATAGVDDGGRPVANDVGVTAGEATTRLVYDNPLGTVAQGLPISMATATLADDIATTAAPGCAIDRYVLRVTGDLNGDAVILGDLYVTVALYPACPRANGTSVPPVTAIPDTRCQFAIPRIDAGGTVDLICRSAPEASVPLPTNFYISAMFSRSDAGVIMGAPALQGFSLHQFDHPASACTGPGHIIHLSFHAQVHVREPCGNSFVTYKHTRQSQAGYSPGGNLRFADDLHLSTTNCNMVAYEVSLKGTATGTVEMDLRTALDNADPENGDVIPGTRLTTVVSSANQVSVARVEPASPVTLPQEFFVSFRTSSASVGPIASRLSGGLGTSDDGHYVYGNGAWTPTTIGGWEDFDVTIICEGSPPVGACCDNRLLENGICVDGPRAGTPCTQDYECTLSGWCAGDSVCRDVPMMNCATWWMEPKWVEGATCDSSPFPKPCGVAKCCRPDDICEDVTWEECRAAPPTDYPRVFQRGAYCDIDGPGCPFNACIRRAGTCPIAHAGVGCEDGSCCTDVCEADIWCCHVEWDALCVREAAQLCAGPPLYNDICGSPQYSQVAHLVPVNSSVAIANRFALETVGDPMPSCSSRMDPVCVSGACPGRGCATASECCGGSCTGVGAPIYDTLWFSFIAADSSARLHTCFTDPPSNDTAVIVFDVGDPSTPETACASLTEIGCGERSTGCEDGYGSDVCVADLSPGRLYYVMLGMTKRDQSGVVQLDIESPCTVTLASAAEPRRYSSEVAAISAELPQRPQKTAAPNDRLKRVDAGQTASPTHWEAATEPPTSRDLVVRQTSSPAYVERSGHVSIQINVDAEGNNIRGDMANEPSIAMDPSDPDRIVIGFRYFDDNDFQTRQAGWAYSHDRGTNWTFGGVIQGNVFRSDPVVDCDADGNFFYYSINGSSAVISKSTDGGMTWTNVGPAFGYDKVWMAIDKTDGIGGGNIYAAAYDNFTRSTDGGRTFEPPITASAQWGTMTVAPDGSVYVVDTNSVITKSTTARDPALDPTFLLATDFSNQPPLPYECPDLDHYSPNPGGLLGQPWVATPHPGGPKPNDVYFLTGLGCDPLFSRSHDGGKTWTRRRRVSDDPLDSDAWHWFGSMCVAPTGRIDVLWYDTRNTGQPNLNELYYSYSIDQGRTWSPNMPVSPVFDSWATGYKLGDYCQCVSDVEGVHMAYAATFNGEHDLYYLRIKPFFDCNGNGIDDGIDLQSGASRDCNENNAPDECEVDSDGDFQIDECDSDLDGDGLANADDRCPESASGYPSQADGSPIGEATGDCELELRDYWRFRNCLVDGRLGFPAPHEACLEAFDADGDAKITLRDFAAFQRAFGP